MSSRRERANMDKGPRPKPARFDCKEQHPVTRIECWHHKPHPDEPHMIWHDGHKIYWETM